MFLTENTIKVKQREICLIYCSNYIYLQTKRLWNIYKNVKRTPGTSTFNWQEGLIPSCLKVVTQGKWFRFAAFVTETCSVRDLHNSRDAIGERSPLREEGIDDSVSQWIDGQLGDPLEIFSATGRQMKKAYQGLNQTKLKKKHIRWKYVSVLCVCREPGPIGRHFSVVATNQY